MFKYYRKRIKKNVARDWFEIRPATEHNIVKIAADG